MQALILTFSCFTAKDDPSKSYTRFDMYDIENKALYDIFTDTTQLSIPGGAVPNENELPLLADVDFSFRKIQKDGKTSYSPMVKKIISWKHIDLAKK